MNNTSEDHSKKIIDIKELQKKKDLEMANQPSLDFKLRNEDVQIVGDKIIYVFEKDGKMRSKIIGKLIKLERISKNLETMEIKYDLDLYTFDGRILPIKGLDRKSVNDRSKLLALAAYGSEINSTNAKYYVKSIENQEQSLKIENFHQKVGWATYEGKKIFKHREALGMAYEHESSYEGQLDISKKGSLNEWEDFVRKEVIGHNPLEASIALGLSAVVVGYIGQQVGVTSQLFHIFGDSSTGKTTVGELIIGTATKPSLQTNGLMHSWAATQNAIIGNLRNNYGLPILFDDSSVSRVRDFSSLLYQMVQGRDKDRMNKSAEMRESETWQTTIISTGEQSLLSSSNKNEGLLVRTIEIGNVSWTKDAAHSERIKRGASKHYGGVVEVVAKELILLGEEKVLQLIEESKIKGRKYLESKKKYNRLHDRMLNTIATVEIAITLLEEKLNLGFDVEEIMRFMLDQILIDDRSIADKAYEDILEYVVSNSNRFNQNIYKINESSSHQSNLYDSIFKEDSKYNKVQIPINSNQKLLGKIEDISIEESKNNKDEKVMKLEREIIIPVKIFASVMKELGYNNPSGILRSLKDKDLLSYDSDRNTRKRKITDGGSTIAVNVIKVGEEISLEETKVEKDCINMTNLGFEYKEDI